MLKAIRIKKDTKRLSPPTYHFWFKPSGDAYNVLARTIRDLSQELNAPIFEPHISLIGNLDGTEEYLIRKTEELAHQLEPFKAILTEASHRDTHFQCLFMLVDKTPRLMTAHAVASDFFSKPDQDFMPHVSLVYGSYPESRKKLIIDNLPTDIRTSFEVTMLYLIRAESPDPKDWHEIGPFPMRPLRPTATGGQLARLVI
jgi:cyclic phosphodiesterase-like protein